MSGFVGNRKIGPVLQSRMAFVFGAVPGANHYLSAGGNDTVP
jgi:hypothetical protein